MNSSIQNIYSTTQCPYHNENIIQLDIEPNLELGRRTLCVECQGKKPLSLKKSFEKLCLHNELQLQRNKLQADIIIKSLDSLRKELIQEINYVITKIVIQLNSISTPTSESIQNMNLSELQEMGEKVSKFLTSGEQSTSFYKYVYELKPKIYKILDNFIFQTNQQAQEELLLNGKQLQQSSQIFEELENTQNFQFTKFNELNYEASCRAIAFNNNGNIMISSANNDIIVWDFQAGMLKEQKILKEHNTEIHALCYSKKQNLLFSGSFDGQIIIWYLWKPTTKFSDHKGLVNQILLLNNENTMISSSHDQTIRIWNYVRQEWKSGQLLRAHKAPVFQIDLNDHQNLMISVSQDNQIIIWELKENNNMWYSKGVLQVDRLCTKASFLTNQKFIIGTNQSISIYEFFATQKQFNRIVDIKIEEDMEDTEYFPFVYNQTKNILINKYQNKLYIISKPSSQMNVIQTLVLNKDIKTIQTTQDGNYIIIFDNSNQKLVIFQYQV